MLTALTVLALMAVVTLVLIEGQPRGWDDLER